MKKSILKIILENAEIGAVEFVEANGQSSLRPPLYDADSYVNDVVNDKYFATLAIVRHYVKLTSDRTGQILVQSI